MVKNTGDRPIQVGTHYAFVETNKALKFNRIASIHKRLNVPSGASVRFEPGETKTVTLVDIGGSQIVKSGNLLSTGKSVDEIMEKVKSGGFKHEDDGVVEGKPHFVSRSAYADMYGPTVGDQVVLGDTS